jgi:hypothetical protein
MVRTPPGCEDESLAGLLQREPGVLVAASWRFSRFGLVVDAGVRQRSFEVEMVPVAPVDEIAEQIAQGVFVVGSCNELELTQRLASASCAFIVPIVRVGWQCLCHGCIPFVMS